MAQRFIGYFGEYLRLRLDETATAARKVNEAISSVATDFERRVRSIGKNLTEEERIEFYNQSADEDMFLSIVDQFTRRAVLISAYSQFEDALKRLCRFVVKLGLSQEQVPRKGFHIGHVKVLLAKLPLGQNQFRAAVFGESWEEIDAGWRLIRNNLVHDAGVVELDQGVTVPIDDGPISHPPIAVEEAADAVAIRRFIENRSDVRLEFGELVFEQPVVNNFLAVASRMINDVVQEIERIAPPSPPEPVRRPR